MSADWTRIFATTDPIKADIIEQMLAEHDIEVVKMNKRDSSYLSFGEIEIYCQPGKVLTALHLIKVNNLDEE